MFKKAGRNKPVSNKVGMSHKQWKGNQVVEQPGHKIIYSKAKTLDESKSENPAHPENGMLSHPFFIDMY